MPQLEYFLICESISIDQESNRISLFNVIEDLQIHERPPAAGVPFVGSFVAVACWNKRAQDEGEDFQATVRIRPPEGDPKEFHLNFKMENPRHRLTVRIHGKPTLAPGQLIFELLLNGKHEASHTVNIRVAEDVESPRSDSLPA